MKKVLFELYSSFENFYKEVHDTIEFILNKPTKYDIRDGKF